MDEKRLTKIALLCSLTGILLLLLIAERQDLSMSNIQRITNASIDEQVLIKGRIATVKQMPVVTLTQVQDMTGSITVIMFDKNSTLKIGDLVEVQGIIKQYKETLEIEAKVVKVF